MREVECGGERSTVPLAIASAPQGLNIAVVGGSNSLIRDGYLACFQHELEAEHGVRVATLTNLSLGGSSSFFGLAQLCRTGVHRDVHILIVEYALNDSAGFSRKPALYDHWARAYEGILRKALTENPELMVVSLILGQQSGAHRRRICPYSAGIHFMSARYGAHVIDLNEILAREQPDAFDDDALYADVSHYSRPYGVAVVGSIVAREMARALQSHGGAKLPRPIYAQNYSHARYLADLSPFLQGPRGETVYQNRAFDLRAAELLPTAALSFRLSGRVLSISFVSHPASASLKVRVGDAEFVQNTARATFRTKPLKFLQSTLMPEVHGGYTLGGNRVAISMTVLGGAEARAEPDPEAGHDEAAGPLLPPMAAAPISFAPLGVLYCGSLSP